MEEADSTARMLFFMKIMKHKCFGSFSIVSMMGINSSRMANFRHNHLEEGGG
jgi:hypothetical protein